MKALLAALLLALAAAAPAADPVRVTADVDSRRVGVEDTVELSLTIEGPAQLAADVDLPPLENLRVVGGPSVSTQISFVNAAMSQSRVYRYVLQPLAVGAARVGATTIALQDGTYTTQPIALEVVSGSLRPRGRTQNPADPFGRMFGADPFGSGRRAPEPKLEIEVSTSRDRVHVGQAVVLTYVLFTQSSVSDLQFAQAPEYPGFWAEELPKPDVPPGGEPAERDGERYRRFPFLRRLLFPTRAGRLAIPPVTLRMHVPGSIFEPGLTVQRESRPLAIEAVPVPEAPGFSGAVGSFEVVASLDRQTVGLGEAATLHFAVRGTGNLKWIERGPEVTIPGARVYPPQVKDALQPTDEGLSGNRTWHYVIVPETAGTLTIPALTFTWFDPQAGRLTSTQTSQLTLLVQPSATGHAPVAPASGGTGRDRGLPLRADLDASSLRPLSGRAVALALAGAGALHLMIFAASGLVDRRARRSGHASGGSVRSAVAQLQDAARGGRPKEEAAALVERALVEVFGDVDALAGDGDGDRERTVRHLHQEVQFIRYAPQLGDYEDRIRELARRAEEAVRRWA